MTISLFQCGYFPCVLFSSYIGFFSVLVHVHVYLFWLLWLWCHSCYLPFSHHLPLCPYTFWLSGSVYWRAAPPSPGQHPERFPRSHQPPLWSHQPQLWSPELDHWSPGPLRFPWTCISALPSIWSSSGSPSRRTLGKLKLFFMLKQANLAQYHQSSFTGLTSHCLKQCNFSLLRTRHILGIKL